MTKQDFLLEATLRLAATRTPYETAEDIISLAKEITEKIYDVELKSSKTEGQFWSEEVDGNPISTIVTYIEKENWRGGYGVKLTKTFEENNIKTVGDLLRLGRTNFRQIKKIGSGSYSRVDDALEKLYNIKGW